MKNGTGKEIEHVNPILDDRDNRERLVQRQNAGTTGKTNHQRRTIQSQGREERKKQRERFRQRLK
ncbi:MAG: hypothetical protein JSV88_21840 [Candidatus Aminicenantes bacterium]|nr:MAG: hypothetical protein JSV88_21840 [Candidatus Aminicenantes bacterium]